MKSMMVFIQTNDKQLLGAKLAEYSIRKNSKHNDKFDVQIMNVKDFPALYEREGQEYLRKGIKVKWDNNDLQSFTLTRFLPPSLMNFQGRAVVIDPDVFSVNTDIYDLLNSDMQGKGVCCHYKENNEGDKKTYRTSVMLLDCEKLKHWDWDKNVEDLFNFKRDYRDWMSLHLEDESNIGFLEENWNHYDKLNNETKLIHYTLRVTQPWKTGLKIDFSYDPGNQGRIGFLPNFIKGPIRRLMGRREIETHYQVNPHKNQIDFFMDLLKSAVNDKCIEKSFLESEVNKKHVRQDLMELI